MAGGTIEPAHYKDVLLTLAAAGIVAPFLHRMKISPIFGYLGMGVLLGPYGLGRFAGSLPFLSSITIPNADSLAPVAEFGVVFLLFLIGLELSAERAWALRRYVFGLGLFQVALSGVVLGLVLFALGLGPTAALILGAALALSSTAIVVEVMAERKRLNSAAGRATFAVLLMQDFCVVPIMFMINVLGAQEGGGVAGGLALAFGQAVFILASITVVGRLALRPLFRFVAGTHSSEMFVATTLLVVVGTSVITAAAGLSLALGAFAAGLLLAETEFRRAIQTTIEPFKGLLLGLFFLTVGMGIDLSALAHRPLIIVGGVAGLILVKALITTGLALLLRLPSAAALETGLVLAAGGEFAFVIIGLATSLGVVPGQAADIALAVVSLTMVAIPGLARLASWGAPRLQPRQPAGPPMEPPPAEAEAQAIVIGFGRVGQLIGAMLEVHRISYIASDRDPRTVSSQRKAGKPVYFGDASRPDFLRSLGLDAAAALVVTTHSRQMDEIVRIARAARPDMTIVARARDARHATELYHLGASICVPETIEASLQLSEAALVGLGVPMGKAIASIHERRDVYRKELQSRYEPAEGR